MMWFERIAALSLAILSVLGVAVWVDLSNRYLAASEVRIALWSNVAYEDIRIPRITSDDQVVTIGVLFRVTNPTGIGVDVHRLSYQLYMDNLTDPRPFFDKRRDITVGVGGYYSSDGGILVAAHSSGFIWANLTVLGAVQPETMDRLNLTFNGKYYPIIVAEMVYRVAGTSVTGSVRGLQYFPPPTGVPPVEP